ncbi:cytochrome C oxidase subunit II [Luteimonas sp. M1R5S18]|jgi:cytochrome c oxidase subunit 2|uniref:Cytochrome C oxidase subunit II n=1 Tax=Luteimonas rhizosphaericola TaxID=3042024 RepID=A0ABT6JGD4_9GAMM|nr:cytochrome C oxidase subunit II [Luteimonas rhizosphaericola]MDH5829735.1 cytochrome C oxidase subunit II [Luteimonas rhizosphaericola]
MLAACRGPQSALDPAGPAAAEIATGWWLMVGGACVAWTIVIALALLAMRRGRALAAAAGQRLILVGGVALPTVLLAALLTYGTLASDRVTGRGEDAAHVVRVTARQWQWQFDYLDRDGAVRATSIDRLVLPLGEMVEFEVRAEDVIHSFWIPRLGGKVDAIPGRTNVLRLRADRAVPMRGQCAEFCGLEHARMAFAVEVRDARGYRAWLAGQARGDIEGGLR